MWARRFPRISKGTKSRSGALYAPTPHVRTDLHSLVDNECLISPSWQATKSFVKDVSPSHRWYFPFQKALAVTLHPRHSHTASPPPTLEVSARSFSLVTRCFNHRLADKCKAHGPFASTPSWFLLTLTAQGGHL